MPPVSANIQDHLECLVRARPFEHELNRVPLPARDLRPHLAHPIHEALAACYGPAREFHDMAPATEGPYEKGEACSGEERTKKTGRPVAILCHNAPSFAEENTRKDEADHGNAPRTRI